MTVLIDNRQELIEADEKFEDFVSRVVKEVLDYEECEDNYEISISLVNNEEMRDLNKAYRNIDSTTDVLSFSMMDFEDDNYEAEDDDEYIEEELPLGDIVISTDKAKEQAESFGHSLERELAFLLVHGMLHLLGYDHEDEEDEKDMFARQEEILIRLNITR